ncbi:MAG: MATE family efflux transporter [Acetatifactor sp.]
MIHDFTTGKITPMLIRFTIPLILGNLFQMTYNAVDSIIAGRYAGKEALAAIGVSNPIMTMMLLFMNGLCIGAGILMGTQYGAKDYKTLHRQISTTLIAGCIFAVIISVLGAVFSAQLLQLLQIDESILQITTEYLSIIMLGMVFSFIYNFYAAVFRALGDSKTPLLFLAMSSLINIAGDLFFVIILKKGSLGCAYATVFSEFFCALACVLYIQLKVDFLRIKKGWFIFDKTLLKKTISYGWVSAMQQAVPPLGKVFMQSAVNTMGVSTIAAFAAASRIDDFCYTPEQNIAHAMSSFMAQNKGAGRIDRMKAGFKEGLILEFSYGFLVLLIGFFGAEWIMGLFSTDTAVVSEGVKYMHLIAFAYLLPAATNGIQGFFRGIGDLKVTLVSSLVNVVVRCIAIYPFLKYVYNGIEAFPIVYAIGWICMLIAELPLLIKTYRKFRIIDTPMRCKQKMLSK